MVTKVILERFAVPPKVQKQPFEFKIGVTNCCVVLCATEHVSYRGSFS